jgi:hypothetical protein
VARERGVHALQTLLHGARGAAEREQPEVCQVARYSAHLALHLWLSDNP